MEGTTSADCWATIVAGGSTSSFSTGVGVATIPYGGFQAVHVTATQTDGISASTGALASASTATMTTASTGSASTTAGTSTGTAPQSQSDKTSSATASSTASHSSNAAMPMMTGNALWVAGGAAAALALAAV